MGVRSESSILLTREEGGVIGKLEIATAKTPKDAVDLTRAHRPGLTDPTKTAFLSRTLSDLHR